MTHWQFAVPGRLCALRCAMNAKQASERGLRRRALGIAFAGTVGLVSFAQAANPLPGQVYRYFFDPMTPNTALRWGPWRDDMASACQELGSAVEAWFATFGDGTSRTLVGTLDQGAWCRMNFVFDPPCANCGPFPIQFSGQLSTIPASDRYYDNPTVCRPSGGNPIYPLTGSKQQVEDLGFWFSSGLRLNATYETRHMVPSFNQERPFGGKAIPSFGKLFESNLHKSLALQRDAAGRMRGIHASRGAGVWISFPRNNSAGSYLPSSDLKDRVFAASGTWRYVDAGAAAMETYDSQGQLLSVAYAAGGKLSYTYSSAAGPGAPAAGLLISVEDHFNRKIAFEYEAGPGSEPPRISRVTSPNGTAVAVGYEASGNLSTLTWPDAKVRKFVYELPGLAWALTGVVDENNARHSTYGYDVQGRAVSTELAGGVNRFVSGNTSPPYWRTTEVIARLPSEGVDFLQRDHFWQAPENPTLQDSLGQSAHFGTQLINGTVRMTSRTQAAGAGCAASSSAQTFDANGNVASRDDFNGHRSCYAHDPSRNLELVRVEGLPAGAACTATAAGSTLPAGTRKLSTQWHPYWSLPIKQAEPGRITTTVYNGQPDPFAGGAVASCAPTTALLPDGKPIAVMCRQLEQATTDADGSQGFAAPLQPGVPARERRWTYTPFGQVKTATDERFNTTNLDYYDDTAFSGTGPNAVGHTVGDLRSVTNAAGHLTQYTQYNKAGQVLSMVDANGTVTNHQYDARQRLVITTTGGQTSTYEYWPTGLLKKSTQADGSYLLYGYDDAHRLTTISDNLGNYTTYTLDNAGNRKAETTRDAAGSLRSKLSRDMDALGRVQTLTGRGVAP